jgi:hypothetical protein
MTQREQELKKVRITKSTLPTYWYANAVGNVYEVEPEIFTQDTGHRTWVLKGENENEGSDYILEDDCEVVF